MNPIKCALLCCLLTTTALAGGCAAPLEPSETTETTGTESDGLTLETRSTDHVAGRFTKDDVVLAFDFERRGETRVALLSSSVGDPLVRATLSGDGIETLVLLGGRATVSGARRDAEPYIEGDRAVSAELAAMREMKLIDPMREALQKAGVSADLVAPARDTGLSSQAAMNVTYWLYHDSEVCFPTWSFWYPTYMAIRNTTQMPYFHSQWQRDAWTRTHGTAGTLVLTAGASSELVSLPHGASTSLTRYYWGVPMCARHINPSGITFTIRVW